MLKRLALTSVFFLTSFSAFAEVGAVNWSGIYGGINASSFSSTGSATGLGPTASWEAVGVTTSYSASKTSLGGQIGYQTNVNDNLLLGVELSYAPQGGSQLVQSPTVAWHRDMMTFGDVTSLSGRIGYTNNSWLAYGKVGYSQSKVTFQGIDLAFPANFYNLSKSVNGVNAGIGLEYAASKNFSIGIEYSSTNWGGFSGAGAQNPANGDSFNINSKSEITSVRLNYFFH